MMNEKKRNKEQHNSNSQPKDYRAPTPRQGEIRPELDRGAAREQESCSEKKGEIAKQMGLLGGVKITDWLMVFFTFLIALAALTYTWYAGEQWNVMDRQLDVMSRSLQQTAKAVELAREEVKAAQKGAETAEEQARITRRSMEIAQRAWIGLESIRMTKKFVAGEKVTVRVDLQNTGRTPGIKVGSKAMLRMRNIPLPRNPEYKTFERAGSIGTFYPNGKYSLSITTSYELSAEQIDLINKGKAWIYVYGIVEYKDIFKEPHTTKYCGIYNPSQHPHFNQCPYYNDAN